LFELANEVNREASSRAAALLKSLGDVLGLLQRNPDEYFQRDGGEEIEKLIQRRLTARKAKNFAEADRIRQQLLESGIVLEDTPQGTIWRRA
jgi:cysteinyl-tRNA synthetase